MAAALILGLDLLSQRFCRALGSPPEEKRQWEWGLCSVPRTPGLQAWACPAEPAPPLKSSWKLPRGDALHFSCPYHSPLRHSYASGHWEEASVHLSWDFD